MRRLSFFILLGPPIIWFCLGVGLSASGMRKLDDLAYYAMMVWVFYFAGALPLLALAGVDEFLARYRVHRIVRAGVCAAVGYGLAIVFFYYLAGLLVFALGLLGAIPAAVCSWLSHGKQTATP